MGLVLNRELLNNWEHFPSTKRFLTGKVSKAETLPTKKAFQLEKKPLTGKSYQQENTPQYMSNGIAKTRKNLQSRNISVLGKTFKLGKA